MPTYQVSATQIKIIRDQRLKLINLEGDLELTARFTAVGGSTVQWPDNNAWKSGKKDDVIPVNKIIHVTSEPSVSVKIEITELETKGGAGDNDTGDATITMVFDNQPRVETKVTITTTADSPKESSAHLEVTLVAVRLP